jgi:hypothetical protein
MLILGEPEEGKRAAEACSEAREEVGRKSEIRKKETKFVGLILEPVFDRLFGMN